MLQLRKYPAFILVLAVLISVTFAACGGDSGAPAAPSPSPAAPAAPQNDTPPAAAAEEDGMVHIGSFDKTCEGPFLVTSIGQSADVSMIDAMLKKAGAEYTLNAAATLDEASASGTLIIAAGASSKGLGAAGISTEDEMARADEILAAAKDKGITVIAMHIGGSARRGDLSDQFSEKVFEYADYIIMVEGGNEDGKYSAYAKDNNVPMTLVKSAAECIKPLSAALGI